MIYHEATRPTYVRTKPALYQAKDEAEAKKLGLEAVLASRT